MYAYHRSRMTAGGIAFRCGIEWLFGEEEKNINRKPSPLVGESVSGADERGKHEQKDKSVSYKTVLNTCRVILERRKNAVRNREIKKYEVEWRIQAKNTGKYTFWDYPMPDSSLLITIWFLIFHFFMYAYHRSRMTAGVNCVSKEFLFFPSYFTWNGKVSFWRKRESFVFWCKKGKFLRLFF